MTAWMLAVLGLILGLSTLTVAVVDRDLPGVCFHGVLVVVYPVDIINVLVTGRSFLTASDGYSEGVGDRLLPPIMFVDIFLALCLLSRLASHRPAARRSGRVPGPARSAEVRLLVASAMTVACLAVLVPAAANVGFTAVIAERQLLFTGRPELFAVFDILPALALYLLIASVSSHGLRRLWAAVTAAGAVLGVLLTGSRSALVLSCLLPLLGYLFLRYRRRERTVTRDLRMASLGVIAAAALVFALGSYLSLARGTQTNTENVLGGPDVTQFDVLAGLMATPVQHRFTYGAALAFFVPRSVFPAKPVTGNAAASLDLTPERYEVTGAETTAGLLGEAWIDVGRPGLIVAVTLLGALVALCRRLLRSQEPGVCVLGLVFMFRGLNLIRGDLTNTVVPLVMAALIWWIVARERKSGGSQERRLDNRWRRVHRQPPRIPARRYRPAGGRDRLPDRLLRRPPETVEPAAAVAHPECQLQ
jgi:hypothetical protein